MNIAILGIGHIAEKMAAAISGLDDNYKPYAAASRSIESATRFAKKWRFEKSYGSYKDLLDDEKECAEHNMLVDLGRNDVGKISQPGTVKVDKYMEIQRYSHVMHIGSTVTGKIREDKDALDVVDAILPAGTLSGAPKIRACEIIAELEQEKRGIYGGAVGYLDFAGNVDTCISIRLAYKKNGYIRVQSGAGIVADSIPENEFQECLNKAGAVLQAVETAKGGLE